MYTIKLEENMSFLNPRFEKLGIFGITVGWHHPDAFGLLAQPMFGFAAPQQRACISCFSVHSLQA